MAKISGTFCERLEAPERSFDRRSFRWIHRGKVWLLIGCPRGHWNPRKQRCKVGTRAYSMLEPVGRRVRCPRGEKRIRK
ncbi:hypothetical protein LCGC14_0761210 [marine sediment metagenome]|uniref:Uncharacterized protein n=1 Tax=marine sediment metagenome TaxID=412755 RepID=A0A0F9Q151_9ZZZZ